MRKARWWLLAIVVVVVVYLLGPEPQSSEFTTDLPSVPGESSNLVNYIAQQESQQKIKPDNQARVVWANDSTKEKTEYSLMYLHGFSASQAEGDPVHRNLAKKFGCNLYLARLAEHGIDTAEPMQQLTVENYWQSAKEAFSIAKQLGEKVIVMGTSTGGSLALKLAAEYPDVHALVLLSPNIAINDDNAWILNNPWGLQLARLILGSDYVESTDKRPIYQQYWSGRYRVEAVVSLQELLETTMTEETFSKITQPVLMLYYYKDEIQQDSTVKVSAMKTMFNQLATPPGKKVSIPMPQAGHHVIASYIKSKDVEGVENQIENFFQKVLKIHPME